MIRRILVAVSALLPLMAGCSVTPKQILDLRHLLPTAEKRETEQLARVAWRLQFAGAEYLVWPSPTADGGLVFAGAKGLRVVFDGREITRIEGLPGSFGTFQVEKAGPNRRFIRGGGAGFTAACSEPVEWSLSPTRSGWRMQCWGILNNRRVMTTHAFERDARSYTKISSTVAPGSQPLTLRGTNYNALTPR